MKGGVSCAKRRGDLVLEIIKGQKTIVDAAREYDLKQSEIQKWMETFMEYGRQGLRGNPKNAESAYEEEHISYTFLMI
jgi:transposase-like protein